MRKRDPMEIPTESKLSVTIAEIPVKELDASNAGDLKSAMVSILDSNRKMVVNLCRVQFIDSSGLGVILSFLRHVTAKGGDLKLCCLTAQVRSAFELVRMHRVFEIFDTQEDAARSFDSR